MKTTSGIVVMVLGVTLAWGCDSGGDSEPEVLLRVATYNAGLATGYVDYAPERLPLLGPAIAAVDADVICLQEVWTDADRDALIAATKASFPHSYFEVTDGREHDGGASTEGPACTPEESDPLAACAAEHCAEVAPENLAGCVLPNCGDQFNALSDVCQGCVFENLGKPAAEIITLCQSEDSGEGGGWVYDGRNGLLILSRATLSDTEMLLFDSYANVRVGLHAIALTDGLDEVDVYCTHLSAGLSSVPYAGEADSWEAEQAAQIAAFTGWIASTADAATPTFIAGDMNCGPAKGAMPAEFPDNYAGFGVGTGGRSAPFVDATEELCTWCGVDNPLIGDDSERVIDHVLVENLPEGVSASAARILDQPVTLNIDGQDTESRLSDHYGVVITLTR